MKFFMRKEQLAFSKQKSHPSSCGWLSFSLILLPMLFSMLSCASIRDFSQVDESIYYGNFNQARQILEEDKKKLYNDNDEVLYSLDAGMLSRYAEDYEASNSSLSQAEKLIEFYFAISVTQTVGSFLLNDTIVDYAGEDFEDIYTNLFMALNYIQLGNTEAAFVEIRRFNNKLQLLSTKYSGALEQARLQTNQEGYSADNPFSNNVEVLEFYDSAFARYVSLILYRSINQLDSAEIDKKFIERAFATQQTLYPFPVPKAVQEEFSIPSDKQRLNVIAYTGTAPEKEEVVMRLPGIFDETWFKLAIPVMEKNSSVVSSILVKATNVNGQTTTDTLEVIESVENIAVDTFQQKQGLIYLKTLLRALSKTAVNQGVTTHMQNSSAGQYAQLFNFAASVFTEISEQADIRSTRYFPALIWVGGLNLPSGLYTIEITCYDAYNNVVSSQIKENVIVQSQNINLVEAVCLQ